jgi:hypothetical protein
MHRAKIVASICWEYGLNPPEKLKHCCCDRTVVKKLGSERWKVRFAFRLVAFFETA